jgi:hypothetical protein
MSGLNTAPPVATVVVGRAVVGAWVVLGAPVVGAAVVGARVVGASVVGTVVPAAVPLVVVAADVDGSGATVVDVVGPLATSGA